MSVLDISDLHAGYGDLEIVTGVDLTVDAGEYVSIIGPNGAGKSTVMKSVFGLTTHFGGEITFNDEPIHHLDTSEIIRRGIGYVPQTDNVFPSLTIKENLEMGAYILDGVPRSALERVYQRFPVLEDRTDQKAATLSGGQQQMLAMGRALMLEPDLLLLDEPSAGLAPELVEEMFERIDLINEDGTSILIVEQNAESALARSDRGYVLVQGERRLVDAGPALLDNPEVREQFLGG